MRKIYKSTLAILFTAVILTPYNTFANTESELMTTEDMITSDSSYVQPLDDVNESENEQKEEVEGFKIPATRAKSTTDVQIYDQNTSKLVKTYSNEEDAVNYVDSSDDDVYAVKNARVVYADNSVLITDANSSETCYLYTKSSGGGAITSINSYSARDMPLLGYANGRYKVMISGATGWLDPKCANESTSKVVSINGLPTTTYSSNGVKFSGLEVSRYQATNNRLYFTALSYSGNYGKISRYPMGYTELPSGLSNGKVYYSYDGIYYYTSYKTMFNNYKAGTTKDAVNASKPYYNYYQYVPLRTLTKIKSDSTYNSILSGRISNAGSKITDTQKFKVSCSPVQYKTMTYNGYYSNMYQLRSRGNLDSHEKSYQLNTGALYGIMLNESANGTSNLGRHYNNLFGYGAYDSCPGAAYQYSSISSAISDYYKNMSKSYASVLSLGGYGTQLGNKKAGANVSYATDPYWGYKAAYNYRLLDEKAGNVDFNSYKVGILDNGKTALNGDLSNEYSYAYSSASTSSSKPFYFNKNGSSVVIVGESGSFYKILNPNSSSASNASYSQSYVYVPKSVVKVINNTSSNGNNEISTELSKVNYKVTNGVHYVWGLNNYGQLGNGSTTSVSEANKINLNNVVGSNDSIKQVVYSDRNVYILTNKNVVYSAGDNTYGQRSTSSVKNKFSKISTNGYTIRSLSLKSNRLRMTINNNLFLYLGRNVVASSKTESWNSNTNVVRRVEFHSNGNVKVVAELNGNTKKIKNAYIYNSKGVRTEERFVKYNSNNTVKQVNKYFYSNGITNSRKIFYYYDNGVMTKVEDIIKNNGKQITDSKGRAYRYMTYINKGEKYGYKRTRQRYNTKGALTSAVSEKVVYYPSDWN